MLLMPESISCSWALWVLQQPVIGSNRERKMSNLISPSQVVERGSRLMMSKISSKNVMIGKWHSTWWWRKCAKITLILFINQKKKEKGNRRTEGRASRLLYHLVTPLHFFFSVGHRINYTPTSTGLAGYCISKIVCSLYTLIFMCRSLHKALKSLTSKIQITPL